MLDLLLNTWKLRLPSLNRELIPVIDAPSEVRQGSWFDLALLKLARGKKHFPSRSRFLIPTACFFMILSGVPLTAQWHSGAPWKSPIASSRTIEVGGAEIQIDLAPGPLDLKPDDITRWITHAAQAVTTYYLKFPVSRARVLVVPVPAEHGVLQGTTWGDVGGSPAFTRMRVGEHTTERELSDDWTMTHELIHIAFPSLADEHDWLEEGLATYVEPIARVQAGFLPPAKVWGDMVADMPKGEAGSNDRGLDRTHTWASTYWGGALFCLKADVMIRQQTGNKKGLQEALRGIVAAGGTIDQDWPITKALAAGDEATGTTVLMDLYKQMGMASSPVDLTGLWSQLGVSVKAGQVSFDDRAPLAAIRRSITTVPR